MYLYIERVYKNGPSPNPPPLKPNDEPHTCDV